MKKNLLGSHVSMSAPNYLLGSAMEAVSYGANVFMVYLGAPQNSKRTNPANLKIEQFKSYLVQNQIDIKNVVIHAPYIVNMANSDLDKRKFAIDFLIDEIKTMNEIEAILLVIHPGNRLSLTKEEALKNILDCLNKIISATEKVILCLEYMSGKGTELCSNFDELSFLIKNINEKSRIGVCLDTCHMNDSGLDTNDVDNVLNQFKNKIGIEYLKVIHINDSKNDIGAKKDRHQNIGEGKIGLETLKKWVHHKDLISIPKILETPYVNGKPPYKKEIDILLEK